MIEIKDCNGKVFSNEKKTKVIVRTEIILPEKIILEEGKVFEVSIGPFVQNNHVKIFLNFQEYFVPAQNLEIIDEW